MSPPQPGLSPVLAVRPFFLAFCRGAILGPGRFWDSPGTPLRPFFWTRGGKGASLLLVPCFVFPVSFCFAAFFTRLEGADPSSYEAYPRVIEPAPRPSEGPGSAIVRGRLDTAFRDIFFALMCLAEGHRDPGTIFGGEGVLSLPPQVPFSHALLSFTRPRFFFVLFFFFLGPWGPASELESLTRLE